MPAPPRPARSLALLLSLSILAPSLTAFAPSVAHAQPKKPASVRETLPESARPQWDAAVRLAEARNWDGARAAFLQVYEASKNPRVLFNVAIAEKELQRYPAAMDYFRRELAEGKGVLTPEEEATLRQAISGLEQFVMALTIEVSEPGAKVYVDDVEVGVSPLKSPVGVTAASHKVRAVKPGFAEAFERVLGDKRNPTVSLRMEPMIRTSRVNVAIVGPKLAIVKVDGREVGTARSGEPYVGQVLVSPEPHVVVAEAPGFVPASQTLVVREGEATTLTLQLAEEQQKGKLHIAARPEGSTIQIDGRPVGSTRWEGPVDVGTHQVVVKKQGFYTWSYDVDVPKGGERSITAALNEDRNTSFVPWLIGTIVVIGASAVAVAYIVKPKDEERVNGTLPPFNVPTPSQGAVRF